MPTFTEYNSSSHSLATLTSAILAASSGITVDTSSISLKYGSGTSYDYNSNTSSTSTSLSFYDGSITNLGIGAGLLLTSGDSTPPSSNTQSSYTVGLEPSETDTDLSNTVHTAFPSAGSVKDATVLQFQFTVSSSLQSIQFDLVFGSDEYPEFSDTTFVDIAGVYVNGTNYALFNNSSSQPLSILDTNLSAGNFRDNASSTIPLEYDGISNTLTIVAPVTAGTNTIKIAVSDTGDQAYDSGLFISNLRGVDYSGNGLALQTTGTSSGDNVSGNSFNEVFYLGDGNDFVTGGGGDDILNGGSGYDVAFFSNLFNQYTFTPTSSGYTITGPDGNDVLVDLEFGVFGSNYTPYALNTQVGDGTYGTYALLLAAFDAAPSTGLLSQWVAQQFTTSDLGDLAQLMIDYYAPGIDNSSLVSYLYQTIAGITPSASDVASFVALIGPGNYFETAGDLFAYAALLDLNTSGMTSIVGQPLALDLSYFV